MPKPAILTLVVPVAIFTVGIFTLYSLLLRDFDPFHLFLFVGAVLALGASVVAVAAGASIGVGIVIAVCSPLVIVAPCEGTGYEIGAVSIVKGARHLETAKIFVDFALSPEGQGTGAASGQNQVPSNARSNLPLAAPDISMIKMVDYDFATFGSPEERSRLLERFDAEIAATN